MRYTRILEIGAHFDGSILSMVREIECAGPRSSAEVVTLDIVKRNPEGFEAVPTVRHFLGNCFDPAMAPAAADALSGPLDLLFIDIAHTWEQTSHCIACCVPYRPASSFSTTFGSTPRCLNCGTSRRELRRQGDRHPTLDAALSRGRVPAAGQSTRRRDPPPPDEHLHGSHTRGI
jgi:hypothetical protein